MFAVETRTCHWGSAMLRSEDCRLLLAQASSAHPGKPRAASLYLYPDAIVADIRQVRGRGLPVPDLSVTFYGLTEFRIDDPDGNRRWIGQDTAAEGRPRAEERQ